MSDPISTLLTAMRAHLRAFLPQRVVSESLIDPANADRQDLLSGVICLVSEGGGNFANYLGREGELGQLRARMVGFVLVEENAPPVDVEAAELALLDDVLRWTRYPNAPAGTTVVPADFNQSKQLEHPFGWITLGLEVRI